MESKHQTKQQLPNQTLTEEEKIGCWFFGLGFIDGLVSLQPLYQRSVVALTSQSSGKDEEEEAKKAQREMIYKGTKKT